MCGIVSAVSSHHVSKRLLDGLKRLEYRGYDSAGLAVIDNNNNTLQRLRRVGKIAALETALQQHPLSGNIGIAHTRWATHGAPSENNAHPFISQGQFALVHNGIIENYPRLRDELIEAGYLFSSETDSEVLVHLLHFYYQTTPNFLQAVQQMVARLEGAFALAILATSDPTHLIAVRHGSPLVIGCGQDENFLASDPLALLALTRDFIYLEEGDIALISTHAIHISNGTQSNISRPRHRLAAEQVVTDRGTHRHFMQREIFFQPEAIQNCLNSPFPEVLIQRMPTLRHILMVACGTSYHAALVARYWMESLAGISCSVEIASEFRYRNAVIPPDTLAIFLSQSGETADTLAALRLIRRKNNTLTLALCNVPESSLIRETHTHLLTAAGPEIGVASTKAFTTQLTMLLRLVLALAKQPSLLPDTLPAKIQKTLALDETIRRMAEQFTTLNNALFIGRDTLYPIALEGALKLKEISYIHAEGYPAGELKHGPLALVDRNMPVIALAPDNSLFPKICSGLQEVAARHGKLFVLTDNPDAISALDATIEIIQIPKVDTLLSPIVYTIPLQLLAYHVAVLKGTDVDQPRNLAKSVTVE